VSEEQITEQQIELMQNGFERYNQGDFDGLREYISDDVIINRVGELPSIRGWDAFRQMLEPDAFEWQRIYPRGWETNGDKLLLNVEIHAKGAGSGIEMDIDGWMVWTVADGIVTRIAAFTDEAEARRAAGLPPSSEAGSGL
jgi:ketosteroid isomerase-like protein